MAPKFTRQHYEVIARAIREAETKLLRTTSNEHVTETAVSKILFGIAGEFSRDNPAFDLHRFYDACHGIEKGKPHA